MPKPELYVIFTGNKGRKPDKISLSKEFFESADIDIEVKAKIIYKSDTDDPGEKLHGFAAVTFDHRIIQNQYFTRSGLVSLLNAPVTSADRSRRKGVHLKETSFRKR